MDLCLEYGAALPQHILVGFGGGPALNISNITKKEIKKNTWFSNIYPHYIKTRDLENNDLKKGITTLKVKSMWL